MAIAEFRRRFSEFALLSDELVEDALEEAATHHTATQLGTLLVAAHLLDLHRQTERPAVAGEITKISLAGQSVESLAQAEQGRESFYTTTDYGRRYLALQKSRAVGAVGVYR